MMTDQPAWVTPAEISDRTQRGGAFMIFAIPA